MTLHDPDPPRKPRRRWLWIPWLLFVVIVLGWTGGWFWLRFQAGERMDVSAEALRQAGYTVAWDGRRIDGFPFRLDVTLTDARVAEPSGWGLSAPVLTGEAPVYALDHWVLAAPRGVVMTRPVGGPVAIGGDVLRASLTGFDRRPPRISVEGANLTFRPARGAQPFALRSARRLELHLRPGAGDQGRVFLRAEGARARLPGLLARLAEDRPVSFVWDMVLSNMSGFEGVSWPVAARAWSASGGTITVREASLTAGQARLSATTGALRVGADGRVRGTLDLDLSEASKALGAMTGGLVPPGAVARASLAFENGRTMLGPLAIAPAPRVY